MSDHTLHKIMYVEDDADITEIAKIALEGIQELKLECCHSGREAISKAEKFVPDLLMIDVMMPEMDGPTTLRELRKLPGFTSIPAIFITAKSQMNEVNEYLEMGAIGVITKPFDPLKLPDMIRNIWDKRNEQ